MINVLINVLITPIIIPNIGSIPNAKISPYVITRLNGNKIIESFDFDFILMDL